MLRGGCRRGESVSSLQRMRAAHCRCVLTACEAFVRQSAREPHCPPRTSAILPILPAVLPRLRSGQRVPLASDRNRSSCTLALRDHSSARRACGSTTDRSNFVRAHPGVRFDNKVRKSGAQSASRGNTAGSIGSIALVARRASGFLTALEQSRRICVQSAMNARRQEIHHTCAFNIRHASLPQPRRSGSRFRTSIVRG